MIDEKLYFRAPLFALLSAFCLSACTDYAEQYEGDYKADYGDAEAFERHLNDATMWNLDIGCQSDGYVWEWCYESDGKYAFTTSAGASWESFVEGYARLEFAGKDDLGQNYSTNLLTKDNVLHMLRRNGGLRVEVAGASGEFSAGVQVKLQNSELYKFIYPGMFVGYTNECADAFMGLKYVDGDGKVVSEYRWDKLSVGEEVGAILLFDELHYVAGEKDSDFLKKANTFEVGLSGCSDTHKGVVIYALAVMYEPQNEGKSSSSAESGNNGTTSSNGGTTNSNGGSTAKSSSSSGNITQNSSDGSGKSSSSVTSNGSTTTSSSANSSSSAKSSSSDYGFLWRGGVDMNDNVKTDFGDDEWFFYKDSADDTKLLRPQPDPYDVCFGYCGLVHFGSGYVNDDDEYVAPFGNLSVHIANGSDPDVSKRWGGLCITYASDKPITLSLGILEEKSYGYAMPEYTLPATEYGDEKFKVEDLTWDMFKQPDWATERNLPEITGPDVAKMLSKIQISFNGSYGVDQSFNIYELGSSGNCGKNGSMKTWNRKKFADRIDSTDLVLVEPYKTAIPKDDLLWYAGNKLKGGSSYLVQSVFEYEKPWLSEDAVNYVEWDSSLGGGALTDKLIVNCGGAVCGKMQSFDGNIYPIIGFDVPKKVAKEWGGLCLTYKAKAEGMYVYLGMKDDPNPVGFNWYRHYLPVSSGDNIQDTCFAWTDFFQEEGWGPMRIDEYLPLVEQIAFTSNGENPVEFSLIAVGMYPAEKGGNDFFAWDYLNLSSDIEYKTFRDGRDNRTYYYVKIGDLEWMAENMNYDGYEGVCSGKDPKNCAKYGRLYPPGKNACVAGWRLPSMEDFKALIKAVGGESGAAGKLMSTSAWNSLATTVGPVTDAFGFSATPGGYATTETSQTNLKSQATFWGGRSDTNAALYNYMYIGHVGDVGVNTDGSGSRRSIRCVRGSVYDDTANTLTDLRDGKVYKTVEMPDNKIWMAENLNYAYPSSTDNPSDSSSFCHSNNPTNCETYGRLYLWSAAMDSAGRVSGNAANHCGFGRTCQQSTPVRGVCPDGWHLPSLDEWDKLYQAVDPNYTSASHQSSSAVGIRLKAASFPAANASLKGQDTYGFTVLPGGGGSLSSAGTGDNIVTKPSFFALDAAAYFWSSTETGAQKSYESGFLSHSAEVGIVDAPKQSELYSVRCLKDY